MKISQIDNKTKSEYLENNYGKNIILEKISYLYQQRNNR